MAELRDAGAGHGGSDDGSARCGEDEPSPGASAVPVAELLEAVLAQTGYIEALEAERTIEAQGRIENLEQLVEVGREFDARADARRRHARRLPAGDRARRRRRHAQRRRGPRHADDAAQRQGPRVPDRLHHRLRGRRVPALARDRRGRPGGGAAPVLRRHHARDARALPDLRAPPRRVRRADATGLRSRFLDEIPADLLDEPQPSDGLRAGRLGGAITAGLGRGARSLATGGGAPRPTPAGASRAARRPRSQRLPRSARTSCTPRSARASSRASSPTA